MSEDAEAADFAADSSVESAGQGRFRGAITPHWSGPPGPNGGYVAALILRAVRAELDDEARFPRSLTVHYLRPPEEAEAEIEVTVERSGRTATTCSARLVQGGRTRCLALCALASGFEGAAEWREPAPAVARPAEIEPLPTQRLAPTVFNQHEFRMVFGEPPFTGSDSSVVGGWIRTRRPVPLDPELLALFTDVWWPAPFPRLEGPCMAPTLELTIHFRCAALPAGHQHVLGRFSTRTAAEGLFEEAGELWSEKGVLLAESRQLALLRPLPAGEVPWERDGDGPA